MSDKCPFCQSGPVMSGALKWECGSTQGYQTHRCKDRQIAQLQTELTEAREFIEEVVQIGRLMKEA